MPKFRNKFTNAIDGAIPRKGAQKKYPVYGGNYTIPEGQIKFEPTMQEHDQREKLLPKYCENN